MTMPARIRLAPLLLLPPLLLAACKDEQRNAYVAPPPPAVTVAAPESRTVTNFIELTGTTDAVATVQLVARVEGYLEDVHFEDGQVVKEGDLLFTIQKDTYEAQLQQAQSQLQAMQAQLLHAQTELERYSNLFKQKAASAVDVDTWRANRDQAQAGVLGAQAQIDLATINLGYTTVTAPFDGRMGRRLVDAGNLVGSGGRTVLAEINRIDPIYAYFTINERDLLTIRDQRRRENLPTGQPDDQDLELGLANEDGFPHPGKLDFAAIALTSGTGTLELRGTFANPDHTILPGLFVRIRAPLDERPGALLVPETAIGRDQGGAYVMTVGAEDVVQRTGVDLGQLVDTMRVIDKGLEAGDRVIVSGLERAVPGRKVTPREAPAAAPATPPDAAPGTKPAPAQPAPATTAG
ncbi:MAG: efflux RND transporter periplasmic adaptor subunit [Geminicoccaceae bacterium]